MATIGNDPEGRKRILFFSPQGKRKTIRLGKVSKRQAEHVKSHVEALASARRHGTILDDRTQDWLRDLDDAFREKIADLGLIGPILQATLGPFLDEYIAKRQSLVDAGRLSADTLRIERATVRSLLEHFGSAKRLRDITEGDAEDFRNYLLTSGGSPVKRCGPATVVRKRRPLAEPTVRKRCSIASKFFRHAQRHDLIRRNPFEAVPKANMATDKLTYIHEADAYKVLANLPTCQWRLLFALSRWGGLRVGSEVRLLTWNDVNWDEQKMVVHSPKTKRHAGHEKRIIPLFPELDAVLAERFAEAAEGDMVVLPMLVGRSDASLRDTLIRAIKDAGLTVWPRLWHNLRSSRQTDLEDKFKPKVVCSWLGNSETISRKHYIQVTEQDYAKAVQKATRAARSASDDPKRESLANHREPQSEPADAELLRRSVEAAHQAAQSAHVTGDYACQLFDDHAKMSGISHSDRGGQPRTSQRAVGEGFEPPVQFPVRRFSRPVPSTTRPPDPAVDSMRHLHECQSRPRSQAVLQPAFASR
jgi:integrase